MFRIAAAVAAAVAALAGGIAPAAAQIGIPAPLPGPGIGTQAQPAVAYVWYEPARSEVQSGRGIEVATVFNLAGPVRGRLQYIWPQSGEYSNLGLAGVVGWGGKIYLGAGYQRTSGRETLPEVRKISEYQPYAFVGMTARGMVYSAFLEAERSFGDELKGTTLKVGVSFGW